MARTLQRTVGLLAASLFMLTVATRAEEPKPAPKLSSLQELRMERSKLDREVGAAERKLRGSNADVKAAVAEIEKQEVALQLKRQEAFAKADPDLKAMYEQREALDKQIREAMIAEKEKMKAAKEKAKPEAKKQAGEATK